MNLARGRISLALTSTLLALLACEKPPAQGAWTGEIGHLELGNGGSLQLCEGARCALATSGARVPAGATLRTSPSALAELRLDDGSSLLLDTDSELTLDRAAARAASLHRGGLVAEIAHLEGQIAHLRLPQAEIDVLGTALALETEGPADRVAVLRGDVAVATPDGRRVTVDAGYEATIPRGGVATVAPRTDWDELAAFSEPDEQEIVGLGELRASVPGSRAESASSLRLARHAVTVRISGPAARTEVEEVFQNDSDQELEGIFRFPLPPDASIEGLTLDVDGKPMEGAFVERDRGAAIWRGVIAHAAPQAPKPREEIIWVPGPWRDPALLEWQRGGRFELRIFPIPARGSRRITLSYTQVVPDAGGLRTYSYPLPADAAGSTKVGEFSLDVAVLGQDPALGVATRGYALQQVDGDGPSARYTYSARDLSPTGDLGVAYALPERRAPLVAWAWSGAPGGGGSGVAELDDPSPTVAVALRPSLPSPDGLRPPQVNVLVVDSSRSMVGERARRARALAGELLASMDPRDRVRVLACDETCRPLSTEAEGVGGDLRARVDSFLSARKPDGGSDLAAAVRSAVQATAHDGLNTRIFLLSDGTPTVGPTRPATLEAAVDAAVPSGGQVIALALGSDADTASLAAVARGGEGVVLPYVPGRSSRAAALGALSASYGAVLAHPTLTLPEGLRALTPETLDPMVDGQERLVLARMAPGREAIDGDLVLRGTVAGAPFEQRLPLRLSAQGASGNTWIPRLYAAHRVADLEAGGRAEDVPTIIAWSRAMRVASRHTSLLVLESEAMLTAFGLERSEGAPLFTGEEESVATAALEAPQEQEEAPEAAGGSYGAKGDTPRPATRGNSADMVVPGRATPMDASSRLSADLSADVGGLLGSVDSPSGRGGLGSRGGGGGAFSAPAVEVSKEKALKDQARAARTPPPRQRWMIPMRKVWDRHARHDSGRPDAAAMATAIVSARAALAESPDSRDRTVALYRLLAATGQLGEAARLLDGWASRDALDGEALLVRSDLAGRMGDRVEALRVLGGVADARPDEGWLHERLADTWLSLGRMEQSCSHRIALAELSAATAEQQGRALRCSRDLGWSALAGALSREVDPDRRTAVEAASLSPLVASGVSGDLSATATWDRPVDLDLALIDREGRRLSWYASTARRGRASSAQGDAVGRETSAWSNLGRGTYALEISGASDLSDPVGGEVELSLPGGQKTRIPFQIREGRAELGLVTVSFTSRLVEDTRVKRRLGY